jgi:hypothetical protein
VVAAVSVGEVVEEEEDLAEAEEALEVAEGFHLRAEEGSTGEGTDPSVATIEASMIAVGVLAEATQEGIGSAAQAMETLAEQIVLADFLVAISAATVRSVIALRRDNSMIFSTSHVPRMEVLETGPSPVVPQMIF